MSPSDIGFLIGAVIYLVLVLLGRKAKKAKAKAQAELEVHSEAGRILLAYLSHRRQDGDGGSRSPVDAAMIRAFGQPAWNRFCAYKGGNVHRLAARAYSSIVLQSSVIATAERVREDNSGLLLSDLIGVVSNLYTMHAEAVPGEGSQDRTPLALQTLVGLAGVLEDDAGRIAGQADGDLLQADVEAIMTGTSLPAVGPVPTRGGRRVVR